MFGIAKKEPPKYLGVILESKTSKIKGYVVDTEEKQKGLIQKDDFLIHKSKSQFFFPINDDPAVAIGIFGQRGSGKSFFMRNFAMLYKKFFDREVYIISAKDSDPSFDDKQKASYGVVKGKLDYHKIHISKENIDVYTVENLLETCKGSLLIFDDVIFSDLKVQKKFDQLANQIVCLGRQSEVACLISRHNLMDQKNKQLKEQIEAQVIFPLKSYRAHTKAHLERIGASSDAVAIINNTTSRWVYLHSTSPLFLMSTYEVISTR